LPIAIQEFCSMKSATMCFTVRSNIHPTSAPTATDDDMEGNKADALLGLTRWHETGVQAVSAILFSNPDERWRYLCHLSSRNAPVGGSKKQLCDLTVIRWRPAGTLRG